MDWNDKLFSQSVLTSMLCTIGGGIGYHKKKSVPSLVGGIGFGSLFAISAWMLSKNDHNGIRVYGISSGILAAVMVPRAIKTRSFIPFILGGVGVAQGIQAMVVSDIRRTDPNLSIAKD